MKILSWNIGDEVAYISRSAAHIHTGYDMKYAHPITYEGLCDTP